MSPTITGSLPGFHPEYNDSAADLVIECKDGIKLRVYSYFLKAHSDYFRAMPSYSESPVGDSAKLIHLDCASSDLASLLGVIDNGGSRSYTWSQLQSVLALGARFRFKHVPGYVRQPASHCIGWTTAAEIFRFASFNRYHDLAKLAIAGFWEVQGVSNSNYNKLPFSVVKGIPGEYGAALIVAMADHQPTPDVGPKVRWQRISAAFDVTK